MEVKLMQYTPFPEPICAAAMSGCHSVKAAHELDFPMTEVQRLIRLAKKQKHTSVLEHVSFTFSVKGVSRACTHQLVRHRLASYSQQSQRHVDPTTSQDWYVIPPTVIDKGEHIRYSKFMAICAMAYLQLKTAGLNEEDARFVLPNACKTNIVITMNARELLHFFYMRLSEKTQWEIRAMAFEMLNLVKDLAPTIFEDAGVYEC